MMSTAAHSTKPRLLLLSLLFFVVAPSFVVVAAWSSGPVQTSVGGIVERRDIFKAASAAVASSVLASASSVVLAPSQPANALDFDAFANSQLQGGGGGGGVVGVGSLSPSSSSSSSPSSSSSSKSMSDDEALCKFGSPSPKTGDACVRAGLPTTRRMGGVDAYGNVDRGNFVRCTTTYVDTGTAYEKVVTCK
uniref:Uncharacterized protein n=1 Tax=Trieres chinensis TaxID=1514140 RepID=A0A7S1YUT1_TRICV